VAGYALCTFVAALALVEFGHRRSIEQSSVMPMPHNPAVNAEAPVRVFNSASLCGSAPVAWRMLDEMFQAGAAKPRWLL